jgi:microsomal dipeptidase-like Zn-dependent dipeptidase
MQKAGFTDEEIAKVMGGNAIRFFREQLPQG